MATKHRPPPVDFKELTIAICKKAESTGTFALLPMDVKVFWEQEKKRTFDGLIDRIESTKRSITACEAAITHNQASKSLLEQQLKVLEAELEQFQNPGIVE